MSLLREVHALTRSKLLTTISKSPLPTPAGEGRKGAAGSDTTAPASAGSTRGARGRTRLPGGSREARAHGGGTGEPRAGDPLLCGPCSHAHGTSMFILNLVSSNRLSLSHSLSLSPPHSLRTTPPSSTISASCSLGRRRSQRRRDGCRSKAHGLLSQPHACHCNPHEAHASDRSGGGSRSRAGQRRRPRRCRHRKGQRRREDLAIAQRKPYEA